MAAPAAIDPVRQHSDGDCVIAAVAMIAGVSYAEVSNKAREMFPAPHKTGLTVGETRRLVRALGRNFESLPVKQLDLDEETGILFVKLPDSYHAVALFEGSIYNPLDGLLWNRAAYLETKKARAMRLLRP